MASPLLFWKNAALASGTLNSVLPATPMAINADPSWVRFLMLLQPFTVCSRILRRKEMVICHGADRFRICFRWLFFRSPHPSSPLVHSAELPMGWAPPHPCDSRNPIRRLRRRCWRPRERCRASGSPTPVTPWWGVHLGRQPSVARLSQLQPHTYSRRWLEASDSGYLLALREACIDQSLPGLASSWLRRSSSSGPSCRRFPWIRGWRSWCPFVGAWGPEAPCVGASASRPCEALDALSLRSHLGRLAWLPIPFRQRFALR